MSFTTNVKKEAATNELHQCCHKAQLSALIQMCSTLSFSSTGMIVVVKTENVAIAKRVWTMLKEEFGVECKLAVIKKMNLKKNNIYQISILERAKDILDELGILTLKGLHEHPAYRLVKKECCARAYLAGAFMAMGSINSPTTPNYHLEIATNDEAHAQFITKLMKRFYMPAKTIQRRNQFVVYLKASEKISDFLRCIGAFECLMKFEDVRISRDLRNSYIRLDNCEIANEVKTQAAASKQLEDIDLLQESGQFQFLDEKLKEVAILRIANPEASLNELCMLYEEKYNRSITKSGMKHRFKKLQEKASLVTKS